MVYSLFFIILEQFMMYDGSLVMIRRFHPEKAFNINGSREYRKSKDDQIVSHPGWMSIAMRSGW
jgi:hypothetical protein